MFKFFNFLKSIDWYLLIPAVIISFAGILTMNSFFDQNGLYYKQIIWLFVSVVFFVISSNADWRFLRRSGVVFLFYLGSFVVLGALFFTNPIKGVHSWFNLGFFAFQPVDFIKLILIILLSKYFSQRHIEIANIKHIMISGIYALLLFILIFLQPDFGSAVIIFLVWLAMIVISGIQKKHILFVFLAGILTFGICWSFVFEKYQRDRIVSFIYPLTDLQGSGYNAFQSTIAVGSGEFFGKGIGLGSQSKLKFLPEYQTDFIFASFAEEWGFFGSILLFALYGFLFWRILDLSRKGISNFEVLYGFGLVVVFISHFVIHVGMNIGLLPVTGLTMPFMSYGGSHLLSEFLGLGMLSGMSKYSRAISKDMTKNEMIGII